MKTTLTCVSIDLESDLTVQLTYFTNQTIKETSWNDLINQLDNSISDLVKVKRIRVRFISDWHEERVRHEHSFVTMDSIKVSGNVPDKNVENKVPTQSRRCPDIPEGRPTKRRALVNGLLKLQLPVLNRNQTPGKIFELFVLFMVKISLNPRSLQSLRPGKESNPDDHSVPNSNWVRNIHVLTENQNVRSCKIIEGPSLLLMVYWEWRPSVMNFMKST